MKNIFKYLSMILLIAICTSCETEEGYADYPSENSPVVDLAGEWYVQTFVDGTIVTDYSLLTTSNTSSDDGSEIQIFDHKNIWWFKVKSPINGLTFSGSDLASDVDGYEITVNINNGIIKKDGAKASNTNTIVDLISFDIEFSDEPGVIYHIEGFKRSGFLEDEH